MKNIQKIALTLIVGVMALGFSAFKNSGDAVADWYLPASTISMTSPARLVFSNYDPTPLEEPTNCGPHGSLVCAARFTSPANPPVLIKTKK